VLGRGAATHRTQARFRQSIKRFQAGSHHMQRDPTVYNPSLRAWTGFVSPVQDDTVLANDVADAESNISQ
jgi:hypothetical protein